MQLKPAWFRFLLLALLASKLRGLNLWLFQQSGTVPLASPAQSSLLQVIAYRRLGRSSSSKGRPPAAKIRTERGQHAASSSIVALSLLQHLF
jgi:hypothetical protein